MVKPSTSTIKLTFDMKKFALGLALLATISTFSCKKKNEPQVNPGNGNNTEVPTLKPGSIVLTMPEATAETTEYTFELRISGADIEVTGTTGQEDKLDKQNNKYTIYKANAGAKVVFSGKIKLFHITAGRIEKADLSQAPTTLTSFVMRGTQTTAIDLSGATELTHLVYRDQRTTEIDLSKQNKVVSMELGREVVDNNGIMNKVIMPNPNVVELLNISDENITDIDLSNLPKLRSLRAFAIKVGKVDLRNSPMLEEVYFTQGSSDIKYEFFRTKNTPNLFRVFMQYAPFEEISIENAPKLGNAGMLSAENTAYIANNKLPKIRTGYDRREGLYFNGGGPRKSLVVTGTAITKFIEKTKPESTTLEVLNLSGNKLVEASLSGLTNIKNIDLSHNALTEATMNSLAGELPEMAGATFKAKEAMAGGVPLPEAIEQAIRAKGWSVMK